MCWHVITRNHAVWLRRFLILCHSELDSYALCFLSFFQPLDMGLATLLHLHPIPNNYYNTWWWVKLREYSLMICPSLLFYYYYCTCMYSLYVIIVCVNHWIEFINWRLPHGTTYVHTLAYIWLGVVESISHHFFCF